MIEEQLSEIEQRYQSTLLRYEEPYPIEAPQDSSLINDPLKKKKKAQLPPLEQKPTIEEILNAIFPPKTWKENIGTGDQWFESRISCEEASRKYLEYLEEALDFKLQERQARKSGICPVREDLHNQLFDEIIRQCTVTSPERGLLLLRVRDNLRMTFAAYQTLYQGSIVFGVKKARQAEEGLDELEQKSEEYKRNRILLQNKKIILQNQLESIEKSFQEIRDIEENRRASELAYLKGQTKHLQTFLQSVQASNQAQK
ncbi:hypothetical protein PPERSA_00085 [Pseudocohnilembus persalinus]|uniref:Axonemal dynein light chain n=1 Tax=Pseudocohnilembus persalinus TaxID=266149 RepID=A0A0V0QY17_PSEPJ|nr:hypothetical protein PPERSA_00085 [Pseudocohnilembus persalinus]|eukprot:KRX07175.1 hypothetical protein PPERSA_00085 [Pseudocohnilembus persalinus]